MNLHNVLPECYADTVLVKILIKELKNSKGHKLGIGAVTTAMKKNFHNQHAVGIIDNDKVKPSSISAFKEENSVHNIKLLKRPNTQHTILVICPGFELWVFENADKADVDPSRFGFYTVEDFKKACKRQDVGKNEKVKGFLNAIKQKGARAPGFEQLKAWICAYANLECAE